ncbi:unnamed protein product [Miscanthus lutarioriparius]|uniref:Uncharacterized protein n=1 Tax=Miscanthus lutarioriparius TaxID=422564 RepID=A0A811PWH6_9POAL|nr:unnamed protein product [Miscanthus lutarioriparius]
MGIGTSGRSMPYPSPAVTTAVPPPYRPDSGSRNQRQVVGDGKAKALPERMQDPRDDDFSAPKLHKKVVYRPLPSGQLKGEPELLRREVPQSSGMVQKPPKRSLKVEPHTSPSDRGTPDSLPESGPTDEYRALRRKYLMLEEENFALDKELSMEEEEMKALEDEKLALLDQLVVLEGLVEPSQLQSQRRP